MGLGFTAGPAGERHIEWSQAFAMPSARSIAIELERANGLNFPNASPPTSPRALGYRIVATVLEMTLGDTTEWSTEEFSARPFGSDVNFGRLRPWEDTAWALCRAGETVAQIDNFGHLRWDHQEEPIDLSELYIRHDRRIITLVAELFGKHMK